MENEMMNTEILANEAEDLTTTVTNIAPEELGADVSEVTPDTDALTPEQLEAITPTAEAVEEMTEQVKSLKDEEIAALPEALQEGAKLWRDASEKYTEAIIALTTAKLHHGEFSEIEAPSEKEVLLAGIEAANEVEDMKKKPLDRALQTISDDQIKESLGDLYKIYGELKNIEGSASIFVDYVADKDNLELTPATRDKIAQEVLSNALFETPEGEISNSLLTALNGSKDYLSREDGERHDIYKQFSEVDITADEGDISPETLELIEDFGSVEKAKAAVEVTIEKLTGEEPEEVCPKCGKAPCECECEGEKDCSEADQGELIDMISAQVLEDLKKAKRTTLVNPITGRTTETISGDLAKIKIGTAKKADVPDFISVKSALPGSEEVVLHDERSVDNSEEEAPVDEGAVAENALGTNDMIQALVEKYRMLPSIETKNFMIADLQAKGFDPAIIEMIQVQAAGNFSEEEPAPAEEAAPVEEAPVAAEEAPVEELAPVVDPVADVASDLFDDLLGTNSIGETDDIDGSLEPGMLVENGAENTDILSGLGTDPAQEATPMADPEGEIRRAEVQAAVSNTEEVTPYPEVVDEEDGFEALV